MSAEALYNSIKSGKTKLTDLNDAGKEALRGYMSEKANPGGSIDSILSDQHKTENSLSISPKPYSMDPVSTYGATKAPTKNKVWSGPLDNPITRTAEKGLAVVGKAYDKVSHAPGINQATGAGAGVFAELAKSDKPAANKPLWKDILNNVKDVVHVGQTIQNPANLVTDLFKNKGVKGAVNSLVKAPISAVKGAINPDKARQNLGNSLENKSLVNKIIVGSAADPLSYVPLPSVKGIKTASSAIGDTIERFLPGNKKVAENLLPDYSNVTLSRPNQISTGARTPKATASGQEAAQNVPNKSKPPISKEEFQKMADSDEYFIRTVRTPEKDLSGRTSTPAGKIGIDLGISNDIHKGLSGFNLKDQSRMLEWMKKEGWEHENIAVYKGKPTKEQVTLDPGEVEFNPSELVGYVPTKAFKEHGGDFHAAFMKNAEKDIPIHANAANPEPIKLTPKEQEAQKRAEEFSKIEDNPDIPNTMDQIQSKTMNESTKLSQKANEAYIKTVDNLKRTDQFDDAVAKVLGRDLKPSDRTYMLGLNSRGSDMVARQIMEKNLVDSKGNILHQTDASGNVLKDAKGKPVELSLKSVAKAVPKGQQAAFEDYLVAKHSITRMGRGEKVYADKKNMTIQKAQQIVNNYEKNPQFVETAQKYYQYNQKLGQAWLVDTGILTQKQWDGYLLNNPHYVPNNRIFSDLESTQQFGSKKGFANQTNPVKRAEGSQRKIVSPFESSIENTAKYVKTAKQNEVAQAMYRNLSKNPEEFAAWGEIVKDQPKKDYSKILEDEGIEGVLDDIASGFEKRTDLTKGNIISALVDGKRVHMKINDPQLLEAMTNLSPQGQHFIMDTIGKTTKTMKVLTTGLNPVFGLTRNVFRDIPMSFIASKTSNNPFVIGKDLLGSIVSIVSDGKLYNAYKNIGGGHSSSVAADRNLLAQTKEKLLPSSSIGQKLKRNLITKPFHALENLNNAVETAPRLGEFKRLQKGTYDSKVKGLYEANDITVNFSKFGNYTKQADALFPYINAAVQGLDKFVRIYKDNPTQAIVKSIGALTMPTIALYLQNHDNKDYQKLSKYTKDNFLAIPKGDGTFYKIAKPRETGIIFSSGVERALQAFSEKDPDAFKEFGTTFLRNFLPPGLNGLAKDGLPGVLGDTIAGPIQSLASNKDFLGRPIVGGTLDKLSPALQYDNKTSEPAKKLGALINYSPKRIDFLIKSYGGIIGQLGIPATTQGSTIKDTLIKQVITDPNYSNDISQEFYAAKDKADIAKADSKVTGEKLTKDLTPLFNKITEVLSTLRKQSNSVKNDKLLSREDKIKKQDEIQKQINDIQENFLKMTK